MRNRGPVIWLRSSGLCYPSSTAPSSIVPKRQVTANGKIEHVFYAFSCSVIVFVEVKAELGASRKGARVSGG